MSTPGDSRERHGGWKNEQRAVGSEERARHRGSTYPVVILLSAPPFPAAAPLVLHGSPSPPPGLPLAAGRSWRILCEET